MIGRHFETRTSLAHHVFREERAERLTYGLIVQVALRWWIGTRLHNTVALASGFGVAGMGGRIH